MGKTILHITIVVFLSLVSNDLGTLSSSGQCYLVMAMLYQGKMDSFSSTA